MDGAKPSISELFRGKRVLITGASGFIGKLVLEKILRCCQPDKVYVLLRPDNDTPAKRQENLLKSSIFDEVRLMRGGSFPEVLPLTGDISKPDFGLGFTNLRLIRNHVDFVFHVAALVRFNADDRTSLTVNFLGAKYLLNVCRGMKKLKAVVHVSTAYAFCNLPEVDETISPPPGDLPDDVMQLLLNERFNEFNRKVINGRPSIYHFAKAMAEKYLLRNKGDLPIAIVRPSVVTAAYQEPLPGWIDNRNGPTGLLIACGFGFVRSVYARSDVYADWIPVDIVVNTLIATAYFVATARPTEMVIVNCASSEKNPLTWSDVERICYPLLLKYPSKNAFRYPGGSFKNSLWVHNISTMAYHWIPAYSLDAVNFFLGRGVGLVGRVRGAHSAMNNFQYFTTTKIVFRSRNVDMLMDYMNQDDREIFYMDIASINWNDYLETFVLGVRRYVLKEPDSSLPEARRHLEKLKFRGNAAKFSFIASPLLLAAFLNYYWFKSS